MTEKNILHALGTGTTLNRGGTTGNGAKGPTAYSAGQSSETL